MAEGHALSARGQPDRGRASVWVESGAGADEGCEMTCPCGSGKTGKRTPTGDEYCADCRSIYRYSSRPLQIDREAYSPAFVRRQANARAVLEDRAAMREVE